MPKGGVGGGSAESAELYMAMRSPCMSTPNSVQVSPIVVMLRLVAATHPALTLVERDAQECREFRWA